MANSLIFVDIYQGNINPFGRLTKKRPQRWRWRAVNGENYHVLATSSEAYTNEADCIAAIRTLFGSQSEVYLRQTEQGDQMLRLPDTGDRALRKNR